MWLDALFYGGRKEQRILNERDKGNEERWFFKRKYFIGVFTVLVIPEIY
jgi:hypothetical protein